MGIINSTELEDYRYILLNNGYSEQDFELLERENPIPSGDPKPISGEIKIRHKKSGIERTYKAGDRSRWVVDFEEHLKNKVFKD